MRSRRCLTSSTSVRTRVVANDTLAGRTVERYSLTSTHAQIANRSHNSTDCDANQTNRVAATRTPLKPPKLSIDCHPILRIPTSLIHETPTTLSNRFANLKY